MALCHSSGVQVFVSVAVKFDTVQTLLSIFIGRQPRVSKTIQMFASDCMYLSSQLYDVWQPSYGFTGQKKAPSWPCFVSLCRLLWLLRVWLSSWVILVYSTLPEGVDDPLLSIPFALLTSISCNVRGSCSLCCRHFTPAMESKRHEAWYDSSGLSKQRVVVSKLPFAYPNQISSQSNSISQPHESKYFSDRRTKFFVYHQSGIGRHGSIKYLRPFLAVMCLSS